MTPVPQIHLGFELLDLGLSDCVFDLELLREEDKRRDERVVGSSGARLHKLSRYCRHREEMETDPPPPESREMK